MKEDAHREGRCQDESQPGHHSPLLPQEGPDVLAVQTRGVPSLDVRQDFVHVAVAEGALLFQAAQDDLLEKGGDVLPNLPWLLGLLRESLVHGGRHAVGGEGEVLGDHLVEDETERVDVAADVEPFPAHLFRRHVLRRPHDGPGAGQAGGLARKGDAEVHDVGDAVVIDEDVLRFQVPVDDAAAMRGLEPLEHHLDRLQDAREVGRGFPDHLGVERPALEQLGHQHRRLPDHLRGEARSLHLPQIMNPADVLMGDLAGQGDLVLEAIHQLRIFQQLGADGLEGDEMVQFQIPGLPDLSHAPLSEAVQQAVPGAEETAHLFPAGSLGQAVPGGMSARQRRGLLRGAATRPRRQGKRLAAGAAKTRGVWVG